MPSPAAWLAAIGALLVLIAATAVVAAQWKQIPDQVKVAALWTVTSFVFAAARRVHRNAPVTSVALGDLAMLLVGVSAACSVGGLGGTWPQATIAGGLVGIAAVAARMRGQHRPIFGSMAVVAATVALSGLAAGAHISLMLLLGCAACAAAAGFEVGHRREGPGMFALGLAILGGLSPLAGAPFVLGVAPGTLARLGMRAPSLAWAAPAAGVLCCAVLLAYAVRKRSTVAFWTGAVVVAANAVVGLGARHWPLWSLPFVIAVGCFVFEAACVAGRDDEWVLGRLTRIVVPVEALLATMLGVAVAIGVAYETSATTVEPLYLLGPIVATAACALMLHRPRTNPVLQLVGTRFAAVTGILGAVSIALLANLPSWLVAVGGLAFLFVGRDNLERSAAHAAGWLLAMVEVDVDQSFPSRVVCCVAAVAVVAAFTMRLPRRDVRRRNVPSLHGLVPALAVVVPVALTFGTPAPWVTVWTLAAMATAMLLARKVWLGEMSPVLYLGLIVTPTSGHSLDAGAFAHFFGGLLVVLAAATLVDDRHWAHAASVTAGCLLLSVLTVVHLAPERIVLVLLAIGVIVAGAGFVTSRFNPADTAALALLGLAVGFAFASPDVRPVMAWTALTTLAATALLHGLTRVDVWMCAGAGAALVTGLVNVAITSGAVRWTVEHAGRRHITVVDLWVALVVGVLAACGGVANRLRPGLRSWIVAGPAVATACAHLAVTVAGGRGASGRLLFGLVLTVVLIGVGGIRRLAAPLILGTVTLLSLLAIAAWSALGTLSVWGWLALGGVALLGLAVLSERGDRETPAARRLVELVWERYG